MCKHSLTQCEHGIHQNALSFTVSSGERWELRSQWPGQGAGACDQLSGPAWAGGMPVAKNSTVCGPLDIYPLPADSFHTRGEVRLYR